MYHNYQNVFGLAALEIPMSFVDAIVDDRADKHDPNGEGKQHQEEYDKLV